MLNLKDIPRFSSSMIILKVDTWMGMGNTCLRERNCMVIQLHCMSYKSSLDLHRVVVFDGVFGCTMIVKLFDFVNSMEWTRLDRVSLDLIFSLMQSRVDAILIFRTVGVVVLLRWSLIFVCYPFFLHHRSKILRTKIRRK